MCSLCNCWYLTFSLPNEIHGRNKTSVTKRILTFHSCLVYQWCKFHICVSMKMALAWKGWEKWRKQNLKESGKKRVLKGRGKEQIIGGIPCNVVLYLSLQCAIIAFVYLSDQFFSVFSIWSFNYCLECDNVNM